MTLWHDMTCPLVARRLFGTVIVCLLVEAVLVRSTPYSAKSGRRRGANQNLARLTRAATK
jgi:hypothetical protein